MMPCAVCAPRANTDEGTDSRTAKAAPDPQPDLACDRFSRIAMNCAICIGFPVHNACQAVTTQKKFAQACRFLQRCIDLYTPLTSLRIALYSKVVPCLDTHLALWAGATDMHEGRCSVDTGHTLRAQLCSPILPSLRLLIFMTWWPQYLRHHLCSS